MKKKHLFFILAAMLLFSTLATAQAIVKGSGVLYTNGTPSLVATQSADAEIAIDTTTGFWYEYNRDALAWTAAGFRIQLINACVTPTYTPGDKQSYIAIDTCDNLYRFRAGTWTQINSGGGGGATDLGYTGTNSPITLTSSTGTDVTITEGGIVDITASGSNMTITASEVDGSITNEGQLGVGAGAANTATITTNTSAGNPVTVSGAGILAVTETTSANGGTITLTATEVDGSLSNEGTLGVGAGGASSSTLVSNTSGSNAVTINVAGINAISETTSANGGQITITATEVDGSVSNELQTIANTSDATSHTATLSNSGGSIKLIEGANITLTTGGTGLDGQITIAATSGSGTDLTYTGTDSPITLNSSSGTDVTITEGGIVDITATGTNMTISATEVDGSTTNELQTVANTSNATSHTVTLSNSGGSVQLIEGTGIALSTGGTGLDGTLTVTNSSPDQTVSIAGAGISVVTGTYPSFTVTSTEVDGSVTNEGQLGVGAGGANTATITTNTSGGNPVTVSGGGILAVTETTGSNGGTITLTATEVDGSVSNEGTLGVGAGGASSSTIVSNTSGASGVTINVAGINSITETTSSNGGSITITATEVDGSTTNELQTIANTSDATSHTATLSNSGGSLKLAEGSGITLTTTGTGDDGIVTIAATGSGATDLTFSGTSPLYDLNSSTGTGVQFEAGSNVTINRTGSTKLTFSAEGPDGNGYYSNNGGNGGDGIIPSVTQSTITNQLTFYRATDNIGGLVPIRVQVDAGSEPEFMSFKNGTDSMLIARGDVEFQMRATKTIAITSTDMVALIGDSVSVATVPDAFDNEATLLFNSPAGTIVKAEGLDPDIIRQNGAESGQVLKWNGTKWAPADDTGGGGSSFYQTFRDNGTAETQRGKANFLNGTHIAFALTDDLANDETEVAASVVANSLTAGEISDNAIGTGELNALAVTNAKINDVSASKFTSGTVPAGFTMTATNSGTVNLNYNTASPAFQLDDTGSAAGMYSEDGTQYVFSDNTSTLIGSGTTNMQYIDGVLRLNDSDLTNYVAIQPPATANLTANYTLTLPQNDGNANQFLQTNGSGVLTWATGAAGDVLQNGNSFGAAMVVGTNDNNTLSLETNGTTRLQVATDGVMTQTVSVANTATVVPSLLIGANSTGTAAVGFGPRITMRGESSTTNDQEMVGLRAAWTSANHATREARFIVQLGDNGGALSDAFEVNRSSDVDGAIILGTSNSVQIDNDEITAGQQFTVTAGTSNLLLGGGNGSIIAGSETNSGSIQLLTSGGNMEITKQTAATTTTIGPSVIAKSTGTPAAGFGNKISFYQESSNTLNRDAGFIETPWTTATDATRTTDMVFSTVNSGTTGESFRVYGNKRAMVGGGTNEASAALQVNSTKGGFLKPKTTTTEMNAIATPTDGLEVYNTTEKADYKYDGTAWRMSSHEAITGRSTAQTAAVASVATLTVGSTDASYMVSGNILVTTSGSESFSLQVDYTDEGNTARTATIPLARIATGGFSATTISVSGAVPYPSTDLQIRCKASTAITIKTSGTFTGCTYNVEGSIKRI